MPPNLQDIENRLKALEDRFSAQGGNLEELIRHTIFYDIDNSTATTRSAADTNGDFVTVPVNPTKYVRIYFRGQPYNVAVYAIT